MAEIHLGGHAEEALPSGPLLIDAHGSPVADPVWTLYAEVIAAIGPQPTLIEWDNDVPPFATLLAEAARANAVLQAEGGAALPVQVDPGPVDLADFRAGLFSGSLPPGVTARDPAEAPRRFVVYRNNVIHSLSVALSRRFPVIERLVGAECFAGLARLFIESHPPESPVLLQWGGAFPGFLADCPPLAGLPYLADVARLELLRGGPITPPMPHPCALRR